MRPEVCFNHACTYGQFDVARSDRAWEQVTLVVCVCRSHVALGNVSLLAFFDGRIADGPEMKYSRTFLVC